MQFGSTGEASKNSVPRPQLAVCPQLHSIFSRVYPQLRGGYKRSHKTIPTHTHTK